MSYDIRFAVKVEGADELYAVIGQPERHSPTYNIGEMFRKCMDWDFEQGKFYQLSNVLPNIERGVHELRFHAARYRKYNSPNGWGDTSSALEALDSIMTWLTEDFKWSWNSDIPLECLYIAW